MRKLPDAALYEYGVIVVYGVVFVINSIFCAIGAYFQYKYGELMSYKLITFAWFALISYNLSVLSRLISKILIVFTTNTNISSINILLHSFSNTFYGTANAFIYLLFIYRVKITFGKTIYQLKTSAYIISYLLIFLNLG
eukprot:510789_1